MAERGDVVLCGRQVALELGHRSAGGGGPDLAAGLGPLGDVDRADEARLFSPEGEGVLAGVDGRVEEVLREGERERVADAGLRGPEGAAHDERLAGAGERDVEEARALCGVGGLVVLGQGSEPLEGVAWVVARLGALDDLGEVLGPEGRGRAQHADAVVTYLARDEALGARARRPALGDRDHGELEALRGVDGHDLDEPLGAARERGGRDLGDLEPAVELLGREGRADREVERELADVGDRGEHVGLAGAAVRVTLEAREPARLADGLQAHVGDGHAAHRASRPRHDLVGARQARGGLGAREELEGLEAAVDRAHGRRVERALATGAELDEVVGVEAEHLAREQREEAGARVLGVGERVQECRHDVDLGRAREGRAAAHDALEAAGPERVDVVGGVREGAEQKRHARGALAVVAVGGEAVGDHRGAHGVLHRGGTAG